MQPDSTQSIPSSISALPIDSGMRLLLGLELPWVLLLGLPLTFPGRFLPMRMTPTLVILLFIFWPLRGWWQWQSGRHQRQPLLYPIGGILVALAISLAVAVDLRFAWLTAAQLAFGIALCVAVIFWPLTQRWPALVVAAYILFALILSVVGPPMMGNAIHSPHALAFFAPITPLIQSWNETLNANILAGGLLLAIPLALSTALAPWGDRWQSRLLGILRTFVLLAIVWWLVQVLTLTDSRGALLAVGISLTVVLILRWPQLTGPVLVVVFLGFVWLLFNDPWMQLNAVMANGMARDYNSRMEIWIRSWNAFRGHLLTGIGIGGFVPLVVEQMLPVRVPLTPQVTHAHNLLLQVGVDLGLLGLLSYVGCMVISALAAAKAWRNGNHYRRAFAGGALAALVALNVHGLLDAPLWDSKLAFLPWLLFALAVLLPRSTRALNEMNPPV